MAKKVSQTDEELEKKTEMLVCSMKSSIGQDAVHLVPVLHVSTNHRSNVQSIQLVHWQP